MREPKYKVFVEYTGKTEMVTGIGFNVMGKVNRIHVGHTEHIIKGDRDKFHLRGYTGIKDKNGVDIYEGDIVRTVENKMFSHIITGQVYYKGAGFALLTTRGSDTTSGYLEIIAPLSEVIGNIYENKKLLEVTK